MFRYASRRFSLTLFIAAAVDTLRCVPTPLLPPVLSRSPSTLSIYLFLSLSGLTILSFSVLVSCSLCALQRLFSFSCNTR